MWANRGAVLGGLAAAIVVWALAVPPGVGAKTGPGVTFMGRDAVGDSGAAPDIVTGTIQQADSLATTILFRVELGNRTSLGAEDVVAFAIDSDDNDATGPDGDDHAIVLRPGGATQLGRWNGSSYAPTASASLKALDGFGVSVARAELGNGDAFGVSFLTFGPGESSDATGELPFFVLYPECANKKDDDKDGRLDAADRGCSSAEDEEESDEPVTLRAGKVAITSLRAGKVASVTVPVTVAETGARITGGTTTCAVRRKGGSRMPATASLAGGKAACRFTVSVAAKGQSVIGAITVVWRGKRLVVPFAGRVA